MENRDSKSRMIVKKFKGQKKVEEVLTKIVQLFLHKAGR